MPEPSNWSAATQPDDQLLSLILFLVAEWLQFTGHLPTVPQLREALRHPGS